MQQLQEGLAAGQQALLAEQQARTRVENERVAAVQVAAQRQALLAQQQAQLADLPRLQAQIDKFNRFIATAKTYKLAFSKF